MIAVVAGTMRFGTGTVVFVANALLLAEPARRIRIDYTTESSRSGSSDAKGALR
jgi:hypothetical protein